METHIHVASGHPEQLPDCLVRQLFPVRETNELPVTVPQPLKRIEKQPGFLAPHDYVVG